MKQRSAKTNRSDLIERIANLPPAKRALLEQKLKVQGFDSFIKQIISRRATRESGPLSYSQRRLWFLDQYEPNSSVYNVPSALRLKGSVDVAALEWSLNEIVRRHEALRTTFSMVGGEPVQVIAPSLTVSLSIEDLSDCSEEEREEKARQLVREEARRPFDLSEGPLFRSKLWRLGEQDHILLLTMHHIVSDGWSMGVLQRELSVLYRAFIHGQPSPLEDLPIQYGDYAVWQREWLEGEVLDKQLSYWRGQLEEIPAVINLPTDHPRPAVQSYRGKTQSIELNKDLTEGLKSLSRKEGVTLFMTLLAAFQTLLYRYTGQEDVVVGSPIANRNRSEIEGLIGFFVNTLVLRSDLSGNPSFRELLGRARKTALEAYEHQDLPFEKLVEELQPERSLSYSPLFQVMFVLQNAPGTGLELEGLSVSRLRVGTETAKFDLTLSMHETAQGLSGSLQYNTDLFDDATIRRMVGHFKILLEGIVAEPEQSLSDLSILTQAERHQLLVEWNDTTRDYPKDKCIHELFEAQVDKTPDAIAVVFEDQQLTYRELNTRANQLAHYLRRLGVGSESLVAICMERSIEMIVGLLGILKAGGAYVPLDPDYPKERLAFMLEDTQAAVLITQQRLIEKLPNHSAQMVCLDRDRGAISEYSDDNVASRVATENLVYVIYTSGSTGKPKGVEMCHRSLCNLLSWQLQNFSDVIGVRTLQFAPLSFDVSFQEMFSAWCSGGTLILIPEELRRDPVGLLRCLENQAVERLFLPVVTLQQLADIADQERVAHLRVREIITAGEQLRITPSIVTLLSRLYDCKLRNHYGPSESHVVSAFTLPDSRSDLPLLPPIGHPIANSQIYILDAHLQPVPIGVPGELHISGDGLARGYLNSPELTAETFIPNPFSNEPGARLYRTGDLSRYIPDGNIEFLERIDNQVKIRGFRIEPGEIEAVLGEHPSVSETVVIAREEREADPSASLRTAKRLVAYVVPHNQPAPTNYDLRNFLKERLPDYMIPSAFVMLEALPLTPNGKIDRKTLPEPDDRRPNLDISFIAPRTGLENFLAETWARLLGIEQVGLKDNFFDLGGHSLLAITLVSQLQVELRLPLSVRCLFESPTIAGLAKRIESKRNDRIIFKPEAIEDFRFLFELKPGIGKKVFFFPGGIGGDYEFLVYARFVHYVGGDYAFHGFRARSADGVKKAHRSVKKMAADYIREIRSIQPEGPYFLVGNCIGGVVAYETACQLKAQGQKIATLVLMDTWRPTRSLHLRHRAKKLLDQFSATRLRWRNNYFITRLPYHWEQLRKFGWCHKLAYLVGKGSVALINLPPLLTQAQFPSGNGDLQTAEQIERVQWGYMAAIRRYRPRRYMGHVNLIVNEKAYRDDPTLGWSDLISGKIEVYRARGDHEAYIREHVKAVAMQLRECLEKAELET